jgi:hypothetical protein
MYRKAIYLSFLGVVAQKEHSGVVFTYFSLVPSYSTVYIDASLQSFGRLINLIIDETL